MRTLFNTTLLLVAGSIAHSTSLAQGGGGLSEPLNVLFIMADQHNPRIMGVGGNGYGGVSGSLTPTLDQLAADGARFENAVCTSAQCSPSRYSILTGLWPHDHGLRWNNVWEPRNVVTFTELARDAGYVTGTIGKHHFHWLDQPSQPEDFGFDLVVDYDDYKSHCANAGQQILSAPGRYMAMPGLPPPMNFTGFTHNTNEFHTAGYWADQTIDFLEQRAGGAGDGKPFVLFYSMVGPHTPILPTGPADPQDWAHKYHPFTNLSLPPNLFKVPTTTRLTQLQNHYAAVTDLEHKEALSYYYGLVNQIDWNIGRVLTRLDQLGLADETLVIYTADHGEMGTEMSCWTKGGGAYDAVNEVPLIARLPGVIDAGVVSDELTSNIDLVPTMLELTGIPAPDSLVARLPGRSLAPILFGAGPPAGWRQVLFTEFGDPLSSTVRRMRTSQTKTQKYVFDELGVGEEEFYDLAADAFEIDNRILDPDAGVQAIITSLRDALDAWWAGEAGHAPYYAVSGYRDAPPAPGHTPAPADGAAGVSRHVDPTWIPSTAAGTQEVWLGTTPGNLQLFRAVSEMAASFNPGALAANQDYYWRVDGANDNGATSGPVWHFATGGGAGGPGLALGPTPADSAIDVSLQTPLAWTPGPGALWQIVWFGPLGGGKPIRALFPLSQTQLPPIGLQAGVTYEWRVDSYSLLGRTTGDVWTFTTDDASLPERARLVRPLHLSEDVPFASGLAVTWVPGAGATEHDVYFGTSFPLTYRGRLWGTSYVPPGITAGTTYYWRVDEVNATGVERGFTWRFETL